jgi:hypothetical protein
VRLRNSQFRPSPTQVRVYFSFFFFRENTNLY